MSNLREAAQAALDALVICCGTNAEERCPNVAITALRAALAKPQPEPVIAEWQARGEYFLSLLSLNLRNPGIEHELL